MNILCLQINKQCSVVSCGSLVSVVIVQHWQSSAVALAWLIEQGSFTLPRLFSNCSNSCTGMWSKGTKTLLTACQKVVSGEPENTWLPLSSSQLLFSEHEHCCESSTWGSGNIVLVSVPSLEGFHVLEALRCRKGQKEKFPFQQNKKLNQGMLNYDWIFSIKMILPLPKQS